MVKESEQNEPAAYSIAHAFLSPITIPTALGGEYTSGIGGIEARIRPDKTHDVRLGIYRLYTAWRLDQLKNLPLKNGERNGLPKTEKKKVLKRSEKFPENDTRISYCNKPYTPTPTLLYYIFPLLNFSTAFSVRPFISVSPSTIAFTSRQQQAPASVKI
jgi:hypothetical protein